MRQKNGATDFETYREIMGELLRPIDVEGLDIETMKRLYESKMVYLESLRVQCFHEINGKEPTPFTMGDYQIILKALHETSRHLRDLILLAIHDNLRRRTSA